jgi:hypothetical protein
MLTRVIRDIVDGVRFLIRPPQPQPVPVPVRVRPAYPYSRYRRY